MNIINDSVQLSTSGFSDMKNLTDKVSDKLNTHKLQSGQVTLFVPGSTGGITTIEYEPGLEKDFTELMEQIIPSNQRYHHDSRWGDNNGFSHLRASLIGPSLTVPFSDGKLMLGTWQQIVFIDFDNQSRSRSILLQFIGE